MIWFDVAALVAVPVGLLVLCAYIALEPRRARR